MTTGSSKFIFVLLPLTDGVLNVIVHSLVSRVEPGCSTNDSTPCMTVDDPLPTCTAMSLLRNAGKFLKVTFTVVPPTDGPAEGENERTDRGENKEQTGENERTDSGEDKRTDTKTK